MPIARETPRNCDDGHSFLAVGLVDAGQEHRKLRIFNHVGAPGRAWPHKVAGIFYTDKSVVFSLELNMLCVSRVLLLIVLTALWVAPASAAIYKWVDENGKVHYSNKPPPEEDTQEMEIESDPGAGTSTLTDEERREKQQRLLDAFEKERGEKEAAQAKAEQEKKERKIWCARAKDDLRELKEAALPLRLR